MKNVLLLRLAAMTLTVYSTSLVSPLAFAAETRILNSPVEVMKLTASEYKTSSDAYHKGGIKAFTKSLPTDTFSKKDIAFLVENFKGTKDLPNVEVEADGKTIITRGEGEGINQRLELVMIDGAKKEFSVNGMKFVAEKTVEANYTKIVELINSQKKSSRLNPFGIEEAHAGGMFLIIALAIVGAALLLRAGYKWGKKAAEKEATGEVEGAKHTEKGDGEKGE